MSISHLSPGDDRQLPVALLLHEEVDGVRADAGARAGQQHHFFLHFVSVTAF